MATFDWAAKVTVKLGFTDVCELLTVLEGQVDHVGGQRDGIYHENGNANTIIAFKRSRGTGGMFPGYFKEGQRRRPDIQGSDGIDGPRIVGPAACSAGKPLPYGFSQQHGPGPFESLCYSGFSFPGGCGSTARRISDQS